MRLAREMLRRPRLEELRRLPLNYDPAERERLGFGMPWHLDDFRRSLPPEPPGEPRPDGSFALARLLSETYRFVPDGLARATFDPAAPIEDRDMLLELRYRGLRLFMGCRVTAVYDDLREVQGRLARVCGWTYGTLAGHVERGERSFEVWKFMETGEVSFRTHAFSRLAFGGLIPRIAFSSVGRRQQTAYGRASCLRMAELVTAAVTPPGGTLGPRWTTVRHDRSSEGAMAGSGSRPGPPRDRRP